jgi:serine phosphatase RsbU (regulator of sigma subunit)
VVTIGGDWYDAINVGDGSVVFVIGDVVGHGVSAIVTMTEIQATLRGLIQAAERVDEILPRSTQMMGDDTGMVATCAIFRLDARRSAIEYVSAGHPPALLRLADGTIRRLDGAQHPPLGLIERMTVSAVEPFPPGAALLAYTDGLVERRGEIITDGIDRLAEAFSRMAGDVRLQDELEALATGAQETGGIGELIDDDIAVIAVRHAGQ